MSDQEAQLREQLVYMARQILALGLVTGTSGNLSGREPGSERILITPSGVDYETMRPKQLVAVGMDGKPLEAGLKASVDTMNHVVIYGARPDVNGVVHTHSPYAAAFSTIPLAIPPLITEAAGYLGGSVRVMEYLPPASPELADRMVDGLGQDRAVLLPSHGVMAVGETAIKAFHAAVSVEESARVAWLARALGQPTPVPDSEVARMNDYIHHRYGQR